MTQEKIDLIFETGLGQQCDVLYTTPDDQVFIRYEEALDYCRLRNLEIDKIEEWYPSYDW